MKMMDVNLADLAALDRGVVHLLYDKDGGCEE